MQPHNWVVPVKPKCLTSVLLGSGCKMCAGLHVNKLGLCDTVFLRNYVDAFSRIIAAAPGKGL